jgi:D-beta-D-heptose 7-phosphate kinase/D-beta-D-heptose 1-phosphate adenosyltransferase
VILNNDNWLKKKKGFVFLTAKERKEIIENLRSVDEVVITSHPENPIDMGVTGSLKKIKPDIFANGGDRKPNQLPLQVLKLSGQSRIIAKWFTIWGGEEKFSLAR